MRVRKSRGGRADEKNAATRTKPRQRVVGSNARTPANRSVRYFFQLNRPLQPPLANRRGRYVRASSVNDVVLGRKQSDAIVFCAAVRPHCRYIHSPFTLSKCLLLSVQPFRISSIKPFVSMYNSLG